MKFNNMNKNTYVIKRKKIHIHIYLHIHETAAYIYIHTYIKKNVSYQTSLHITYVRDHTHLAFVSVESRVDLREASSRQRDVEEQVVERL